MMLERQEMYLACSNEFVFGVPSWTWIHARKLDIGFERDGRVFQLNKSWK